MCQLCRYLGKRKSSDFEALALLLCMSFVGFLLFLHICITKVCR